MHLLGPNDVLVGITFHGASRTIVEPLEYARKRGITTICVTAAAGSPAAELASIPLVVFSGDEPLASGQFASRKAATVLLKALTTAVASQRRDTALPHAQDVTSAAQQLHGVTHRRPRASRRNAST